MAIFKAFKAFRPTQKNQNLIPALPYDVMNSDEARVAVKGNPLSFLHIDKAEIDLDKSVDIYDDAVYAKAKENLDKLENNGDLVQDETPCFYIYKQVMNGRSQVGIVGCASIDDYINNVIKKHEMTRADKEADRIRHVDTCNANTGPIFLTYRSDSQLDIIVNKFIVEEKPTYDFVTDDGIANTVWVVSDEKTIKSITKKFGKVDSLYIADGHHRCASAAKVGLMRREKNKNYTGEEEFNYFLAVAFPDNQLEIMDYNRVVADLNGKTEDEFIKEVSKKFTVETIEKGHFKPSKKHTFGMYLGEKWYSLSAKNGTFDISNPVDRLDVSILQNNLLHPILGIGDPKTDKRIDFVGGIRGLEELEKRVKTSMAVAFSMYPTTVEDLMNIADAKEIMPPKSTWFEPKLLSGLFIHHLD